MTESFVAWLFATSLLTLAGLGLLSILLRASVLSTACPLASRDGAPNLNVHCTPPLPASSSLSISQKRTLWHVLSWPYFYFKSLSSFCLRVGGLLSFSIPLVDWFLLYRRSIRPSPHIDSYDCPCNPSVYQSSSCHGCVVIFLYQYTLLFFNSSLLTILCFFLFLTTSLSEGNVTTLLLCLKDLVSLLMI